MAGINESEAARRTVFRKRMGANLRELRLAAGLSQAAVADTFSWNRDAISKIEAGQRNVSLYEYLRLIDFLKPVNPSHPAHALTRLLMPIAPRR